MALGDNIISYWKWDAASGNAADSAGSNTLTNNNTTPYVAGLLNNAADFEASSNQNFSITAGAQTGLNYTGDHSWQWWFKPESFSAVYNAFASRQSVSGNDGYQYGVYDAGAGSIHLNAQISNGTGQDNYDAVAALTAGNWYHIVWTWNSAGKNGIFYINGSSAINQTKTRALNDSGTTFNMGSNPGGTSIFLDGILDETGLWGRELTSAEVTTLYNSGTPLPYPYAGAAGLAAKKLLLGVGI
jgi:hypothetical protein